MKSCIECEFHMVVGDPDPQDSFNADDCAVLCKKSLPLKDSLKRSYDDADFDFRPITVSCRPYNIRKETTPIPDWCPLVIALPKTEYKNDDVVKPPELLSASEARDMATTKLSTKERLELECIAKTIKGLAIDGFYTTSFSEICENNINILKDKGYTISSVINKEKSTIDHYVVSW